MAKNRDRRREHKPEPPKKGDPTPLRRARPDLLLRVYRHVHDDCGSARWQGWTAMQVARALRVHVDDVTDCLLHMVRIGQVSEHSGLYCIAPPKPEPKLPPKVPVNPALLLKVRKVFDRVATAKLEDFGGLDGVQGCIDELVKTGWLSKLTDGSFCVHHRRTVTYSPVLTRGISARQEYRGNGKCPWCDGKTRRHARAEVHDPIQCKQNMIRLIMSD